MYVKVANELNGWVCTFGAGRCCVGCGGYAHLELVGAVLDVVGMHIWSW